jgi:HAD superfamily hydrolase (TIGR01509 family)
LPLVPRPILAVCFDLDGLVFNTEDVFNAAGRELLRRRSMEMHLDVLREMMGRRSEEAFAILVERTGLIETVPVLLEEARRIFADLLEVQLAPMPGAFDLFDHIDALALPMAVATSSHRAYCEDLLGRFDLLERFEFTLTAEDVTHGKPHPEIYLAAAKRLGVPPSRMLVLEDSEIGTRAAAAAGAVVVSVPHDHSRHMDFTPATLVAEGLGDPRIRNWLERPPTSSL